MPYRDDLEAALRRAEALEADRDVERARERATPDEQQAAELRRQLSLARMQLGTLRSERFQLDRTVKGLHAELAEERHARELLHARMRIFREKLAKQTLEFDREKEARQWAVHAAREAAEALREMRLERASFRDAMEAFELRSIAREEERAERATDEIKRRLLSWVGAEHLREDPAPTDLDDPPEQGLQRFVGRFGPEALRDLAAPRRAGRLRELACRIARSVWVEGDDSINFEPALLLLGASGHRLAPRHGATLRFDVRRDGLSVEWLDEAQPIEVRLSASDGFALRGVREWARTPIH